MTPAPGGGRQTEMLATNSGRIMAMDSAYDVCAENRGRDVVINASYCGVLPARFISEHAPRASLSVDCGVGPQGAAIAGLWYLEALGTPAAVVAVESVLLGDGVDVYTNGIITYLNQPARDCGVTEGMRAADAAQCMLTTSPTRARAAEVTNRVVMATGEGGRQIVCSDSIAFGTDEDTGRSVLVTAGHTGRSAVPYLTRIRPLGFICSDGGGGREASGTAGLRLVEALGLAGATVDATSARMGDGLSTWYDGIISACNRGATAAGVEIGMTCQRAAAALMERGVAP